MVHSNRKPLQVLYERDNGICWRCGEWFPIEQTTRDHVVPKSMGGGNGFHNLKLCCRPCNESKGDTLDDDSVMLALEQNYRKPPKLPKKYTVNYKRLPPLHGSPQKRRQQNKLPKSQEPE